jgi:hypothetical protein
MVNLDEVLLDEDFGGFVGMFLYRTVRDFYLSVNFFAYVAWYKNVAEKIMSLKFDVGYIELRSQPVQVRTQ